MRQQQLFLARYKAQLAHRCEEVVEKGAEDAMGQCSSRHRMGLVAAVRLVGVRCVASPDTNKLQREQLIVCIVRYFPAKECVHTHEQ